jgi:KaiC/GvpD/RAD55 family RecA-like ATPase
MSDYDLSGLLDVPALAAVDPGTSLLVAGPAMVGTAGLARAVLADGARRSEGVIAITTNRSAVDVIEEIRTAVETVSPARLAGIDCRGGTDAPDEAADRQWYRYGVEAPNDVTGMGVGITNSFERLRTAGADRIRLGLDSLSAMVAYADPETVFKFCHVLTSRIDSAGYLGVFTIDVTAHDDQTVQVVTQPFDGLIEVRNREGAREARVRGLTAEPSPWLPV